MSFLADGADAPSFLVEPEIEESLLTKIPTTMPLDPFFEEKNASQDTTIPPELTTTHTDFLPVPDVKTEKEAEEKSEEVSEGRLELIAELDSNSSDSESSLVSATMINMNLGNLDSCSTRFSQNFVMESGGIDSSMAPSGAIQFIPGVNLLPTNAEILIESSEFIASEMPTFDMSDEGAVSSIISIVDGNTETEIPVKCCEICSKPIEGEYRFINGFFYHPDCIHCRFCNKKIPLTKEAHTYKGDIICESCKDKIGGRICAVCNNPIINDDDCITLQNGDIQHKSCLSCYACSKKIEGDDYIEVEGVIMCKKCHQKKRLICTKCGKLIRDDFFAYHNRQYFHQEHFCCTICNSVLYGNNYVVHHNKFYCKKHGSVYLDSCATCKKMFVGATNKIRWLDKYYHPECLICRVCGKKLTVQTAHELHRRPYCFQCFKKRRSSGGFKKNGRSLERGAVYHPEETRKRREEVKDGHYPEFPKRDPLPLEDPPTIVENALSFVPVVENLTKYV